MATSSFFTDITIKDRKTAKRFLEALEKAEKTPKKKVDVKYKTVNDRETIRSMFLE